MDTTPVAGPVARVVAADAAIPRASLSRRRLLRLAVWTSLGATAVAAGGALVTSLWPRGVSGFGGPVTIPAERIPKPGAPPLKVIDGRFWLVNLPPGEGRLAGDATAAPGGLLALWTRCPHLGCSVPWNADHVAPKDDERRKGWFLCPCHGSTYSRAGVRIFGPAERSMDTMRIDIALDSITVQTGEITKGANDNTSRAVPWSPPELS